MSDFDAAAQFRALEKETKALEYFSQQESGAAVATRLYEDIARSWCSLRTDERAETAQQQQLTSALTIMPDGDGDYNTLIGPQGGAVVTQCNRF
jgi:hypothetical protein